MFVCRMVGSGRFTLLSGAALLCLGVSGWAGSPAGAAEPPFWPLDHEWVAPSLRTVAPFEVEAGLPERMDFEFSSLLPDFVGLKEPSLEFSAWPTEFGPLATEIEGQASRHALEITAEIGAIRRELRGGALWEFGAEFDAPEVGAAHHSHHDFAAVLRRVVAESETSAEPPMELPFENALPPPLPAGRSEAGNPQGERIAALRGMARELEQEAADLEESGAFDRADRLREQVQTLRGVARALDSGHGAPDPLK